MASSGDAVARQVEAALFAGGEFPLGWFLVYEGFSAAGERTLHYANSQDLAYWQGLGMLYTAIDNLRELLGSGEVEDE